MPRDNLPSKIAKEFGRKNYTKAELLEKEKTEVIAPEDDVQPSRSLPKRLHKRFFWYVEQFKGMGILTNVDTEALSRYLIYVDHFWKIQKLLDEANPDEEGYTTLVNNLNKYSDRALNLEKELGLTMVSRMKIKKSDESKEDKPKTTEELLFGEALKIVK